MRHIISLSLILVGLLAHCAPVPRQPDPMPPAPEAAPRLIPAIEAPLVSEPQPQPYIHEVRWPGETLSHIARWHTSSVSNWEKIAEANPGLNPRRIQIGDKILIPEKLLKVRKPMPREYVHSLVAPKRPPSATSVQRFKDPEKAELFGPAELLSPPGAAQKTELYGPIDLDQTPAQPQPSSTGR